MKKISLLLAILLWMTANAEAQFGRLNRALEKTVENALEKVLEKEVEKAIEGEENKTREEGETSASEEGASFFEIEESGKYVASYAFDYEYHLTSEQKGKASKMIYYLTKSKSHTAFQAEEKDKLNYTLIDTENKRNYLYSEEDGKKNCIKIPFINMQKMMQKSMERNMKSMEEEGATIEPLNKSRVIAGYRCDGFKMTSEETISIVWVTKDAPVPSLDIFNLTGGDMPEAIKDHPAMQGLMMEMESYPPGKEEKKVKMFCTYIGASRLKLVNEEWGYQSH